jgi:flavin-dependent dehydrogenase
MGAHTRYDYDVLVVGAGGAGLRAAIEAASAGVSVGLICKSLLGGRHRRGPVERRRSRQLEGAFRRHDARRPVCQ